jgi:hypothetical protein
MKRRSRKKLHATNLDTVLLTILATPEWRDTVLSLQECGSVFVDPDSVGGRHDGVSRLVKRHGLRFELMRIRPDESHDTAPGDRLFRLQAREFPELFVFAEENPEKIGVPG